MSSFFNRFSLTKSHKYETQKALDALTAKQIIELHPEDVGLYIESRPADPPLSADKAKALRILLDMKKYEKKNPTLLKETKQKVRQEQIDKFLGPTKEEMSLIVGADKELRQEDVLKRRLDLLKGYTRSHLTQSQKELQALDEFLEDELGGGKRKKTKKHRKRKNQTKYKKHRKSKKRSLHKSKRR